MKLITVPIFKVTRLIAAKLVLMILKQPLKILRIADRKNRSSMSGFLNGAAPFRLHFWAMRAVKI